jgi:CheY-like chemotaxis protein
VQFLVDEVNVRDVTRLAVFNQPGRSDSVVTETTRWHSGGPFRSDSCPDLPLSHCDDLEVGRLRSDDRPIELRVIDTGMETTLRTEPDLAARGLPVLCDIALPKLDGYGVARRLRAASTLDGVPLIAVTAFAMVGDRDKVVASGSDRYISKPISARDVRRRSRGLPSSPGGAWRPS